MIAFHPPLSGLPFAFVLLLVFVESARLSKRFFPALSVTRGVLIVAVIVSTALTFLSGYQASGSLADLAIDVEGELGRHHAYGRLLLINSFLLGAFAWIAGRAVYGRRFMMAIYIASLVAQLGLTVAVGSMGGALVFERGLGVRVH